MDMDDMAGGSRAERGRRGKSAWDKEYATSFYDEVMFLRRKGIRYEWVYSNEYGISVWKYRKTRKLWLALADMYSDLRYEA